MTDYAEEQQNEIEALESIYPDEIEILQDSPHIFVMTVASQDPEDCYAENPDGTPEKQVFTNAKMIMFMPDEVGCTVQFTYTPKYPDEAPLMELTSTECLEDDQITMIDEFLKDQAEENLGMVMVFTIISALQERLTVLVEEMKNEAEEKRLTKRRAEEEVAQKRFEGTRVCIETFLAWKAGFDAERLSKKVQEKDKVKDQKPTGRELFMTDASLNDSDINFLQDDTENVEVDETLFDDMEDLELEEDEDEDPDYVP